MLIDDLANGLADHVHSTCITCSPHALTPENKVCFKFHCLFFSTCLLKFSIWLFENWKRFGG